MENVSIIVIILFSITTLLTVWQFFRASGNSRIVLLALIAWMGIQAVLGLSAFYQQPFGFPPRFVLLIGPGFLFSLLLFITPQGKAFIDSLNLKHLTLLHAVRIPVEITLYYVFIASLIPKEMTFEGSNFDILSGLSAPIIYYLVFIAAKANNKVLLVWNFACLGLLMNVLTIAFLSAQTPFQQIALDQPNIVVTFFPFVWLPGVVVPLVLISHLAAIRQIIFQPKPNQITEALQNSNKVSTQGSMIR